MMVKLYANWDNHTILTEKQVEKIVANEYYANATSRDSFNEWLSENYNHGDLFDMDEGKKRTVRDEFKEEMKEVALDDFIADEYEEIFVEI